MTGYTRAASAALLAAALTTLAVAQPGKGDLKTVTYPELGEMVRGLKGKVAVVYFWADY